jgi:hypothetical protein
VSVAPAGLLVRPRAKGTERTSALTARCIAISFQITTLLLVVGLVGMVPRQSPALRIVVRDEDVTKPANGISRDFATWQRRMSRVRVVELPHPIAELCRVVGYIRKPWGRLSQLTVFLHLLAG